MSRYKAISTYVESNLLCGGEFRCIHALDCLESVKGKNTAFYEGQMPHVGKHYDQNGTPMRVMVLGQEMGKEYAKTTLEERYQRTHDVDGKNGFKARNPHMRGTTLALKTLFDIDIDDVEDEMLVVNGVSIHLFDAFTLMNALLCSAVATGKKNGKPTMNGKSSKRMQENCKDHLSRTIELLQPNIIVAQGGNAVESLQEVLGDGVSVGQNLRQWTPNGELILACEFSHPSAPSRVGWRSRKSAYFQNVVRPTLLAAREKVCGVGVPVKEAPKFGRKMVPARERSMNDSKNVPVSRMVSVENYIDRCWKMLKGVEAELKGKTQIYAHQQDKSKGNMSFRFGKREKLSIHPLSDGQTYQVGLSGRALIRDMYTTMTKKDLCGDESDGYHKPEKSTGKVPTHPFWNVKDFGVVRKAIHHYAKIRK